MREYYKRVNTLYSKGGLSEVLRGVRDHVEHEVLGEPYSDTRSDNDGRWEFISSYITDTDSSLIDIGCAEGVFVAHSSEMGLDSTGYDLNVARINRARKRYDGLANASFNQLEFTPDNISEIPDADVILFMTVHHHWESAFGFDNASDMLRCLMNKSNKLFYEPPGHRKMYYTKPMESISPDDPVDWYKSRLNKNFEDINIIDCVVTNYKENNSREDPLFI